MAEVFLTHRARADLEQIGRYSVETWGEPVADEYLAEFDLALQRLQTNPGLLRQNHLIDMPLRFYRVRKHFLICDVFDDDIYILAVRHGGMDLPSRIAELEPILADEARIMHDRVMEARKNKPAQ